MTSENLKQIFDELLSSLGLTLETEVSQDGDRYLVNINGAQAREFESSRDNRSLALLILVKQIAKKQYDVEPKMILDFNFQRQQRLDNIVQMAKKTAELVRVRGGEEELRPMSPAERRAVHMALKEMSGIRTESRGTEPHRRIVIIQE